MSKKILLSSPHLSDEGYEMEFVKEAFDTNWIAPLGENVNKFEEEMAMYTGVESAAALVSGTSAIHLALKAVGVKKDDIVFCSSLTFSATANPIMYEGAIPVFIDSEYETFNMCPLALEKAFIKYPNVKAVLVVHLYGIPANMEEICKICAKHNVSIIEDAAESLGATINGKQTGSFGEYGAISFNGNKIITTSGGGMLLSNNSDMIKKVRFWATQSRENERHYEHKEIGYNYRMSNVVAGIGRGQLKVLNDRICKKTAMYNQYKEAFKDISSIQMQGYLEGTVPNFWLSTFTLSSDSKVKPLDIIMELDKNNIEARHIWKPMHMQPIFNKYDFISIKENGVSVSEDIFNRGICLPSDTKNTNEDMDKVIKVITNMFK